MNEIEQFIDAKIKHEFEPIFLKFRTLIKEKFPTLQEAMRGGTEKYYGVPVYRQNKIIISVSPTQKGITFSFAEGKQFEDKYGLLEGVGNKTLNLRITSLTDYSEEVLEYYIRQGIQIDNKKK
ncbi:DUF1801 domain-containing protein [Galbibacter pacificus]|uniref:DUF1801 domain-containing protein n=1 Tax=Galbibacter pacificus TaxID=2996052 RepID=A0ABT6FWL4_9FLAO|nr:DUF1801 domain-containing protein [Galbibacter pacificus]MDG3584182.1 DUF1801 domain-containing protein [Galbibacter pacificus]MDG3587637.1 DUF1801 domain-containing protein [Galbibacter pacificus]